MGPQKGVKGKRTEAFFEITSGRVNNIELFRSIAAVMWFRRDGEIATGALIEPPEHFGRLDALVEFWTLDQRVVLLPKPDFTRIAKVPAVADDAMLGRW